MMTMHRWFECSAAVRDLGYKPIKSFREEWPRTITWFRENWLPIFAKCVTACLCVRARASH